MFMQGWIKLLHQMVLKLPEVSNLKSLVVLCNEDGEEFFFDSISDSVVCFFSEHFMVICLLSLLCFMNFYIFLNIYFVRIILCYL